MAKIFYVVTQNQAEGTKAYGKWYAQAKSVETLNTRRLAAHIAEHGSIYTPDVVYGVLEKFRSCLIEMLLDSKKVKIDGLGIFYCTLENVKGGAAKKEDFNVNTHLEALHIRFLPEQEAEQNISSREFLKKAEFINIELLSKTTASTSNGEGTANESGSGEGSGSEQSGSGSEQGGSGDSNSQTETVAAPTINGDSPFAESTEVTLTGPDGAEIHYTTDGSDPTAESTLYSQPFTLTEAGTVKAIAIKNGVASEIASSVFTKSSGGGGGFESGD